MFRATKKVWLLALPLLAAWPAAGRASDNDTNTSRLFERPVSIQEISASSNPDPVDAIRCTYYPDFMIRESGTDSPAPNDAVFVPGVHPACSAAGPATGERVVATANYSLLGKIGRFVLFSATDPNGAVPFMVLDAATGRTIYTDATAADHGIDDVAADQRTLHLQYMRGFNASCSIMQNPTGCWAKLVAEGKIPQAMTPPAPSPQLCVASYKQANATPDDPSVVTYPVDMTIEASGRV
ncbi:MAG TPA: hypothetical protein VLI90_03775, partial [Tepidisphaeraceae bacterium]|nr:hypothetical protein [Tepidisphaeraceae bacterium]